MGLGGAQALTASVTMTYNSNNYTFYGATPAEIATLPGIGAITGSAFCNGTLCSSTAPYVITSVSALRVLSITTHTMGVWVLHCW